MEPEDIALFDMDGTLCDYEKGLKERLAELRSSSEPPYDLPIRDNAPAYIKNRANLVRSSEQWWEELPRLELGWDILKIAKDLGFRIMILTQGPKSNPAAWSGKKKWIDKNLGREVDVTITRDKGLVYGKVLVDDFPDYADRWLAWRKRGLVIMPTNNSNREYTHQQVIHYDGTNLEEVKRAMQQAKSREE